jgi:hypothetical protein
LTSVLESRSVDNEVKGTLKEDMTSAPNIIGGFYREKHDPSFLKRIPRGNGMCIRKKLSYVR